MKASDSVWAARFISNTLLSTTVLFIFLVASFGPQIFLALIVLLLVPNAVIMLIFWFISWCFSRISLNTEDVSRRRKMIGLLIASAFYYGGVLILFTSPSPAVLNALSNEMWILSWMILSILNVPVTQYVTEERAELLDDQLDRFFTSRLVALFVWMFLGAQSGVWLLQALVETLSNAGFGEFPETTGLISSAIVFGASLSIVSVAGRKDRLSMINPDYTAYMHAMRKLGIKRPKFLEVSVKRGEEKYLRHDLMKSQNGIEKLVPWALFFVSLTWWRIVEIDTMSTLDSSITWFCIIASAVVIYAITRNIHVYRKWRNMWASLWNFIGLLSLHEDNLMLEYLHLLVESNAIILLDSQNDMTKYLEEQYAKYSINSEIPKDPDDLRLHYVNIELFELSQKRKRNLARIGEKQKQSSLYQFTYALSESITPTDALEMRKELIMFLLYSNAILKFNLPEQMYEDLSSLIDEAPRPDQELVDFCSAQIGLLEETPAVAIPQSVKWLPVIYSFAIWLTTSILSLLGI